MPRESGRCWSIGASAGHVEHLHPAADAVRHVSPEGGVGQRESKRSRSATSPWAAHEGARRSWTGPRRRHRPASGSRSGRAPGRSSAAASSGGRISATSAAVWTRVNSCAAPSPGLHAADLLDRPHARRRSAGARSPGSSPGRSPPPRRELHVHVVGVMVDHVLAEGRAGQLARGDSSGASLVVGICSARRGRRCPPAAGGAAGNGGSRAGPRRSWPPERGRGSRRRPARGSRSAATPPAPPREARRSGCPPPRQPRSGQRAGEALVGVHVGGEEQRQLAQQAS